MLFGAKKPSCDDIETLKPIGAIDTEEHSKAIDAANPKGTAPVAASLTAAKHVQGDRRAIHHHGQRQHGQMQGRPLRGGAGAEGEIAREASSTSSRSTKQAEEKLQDLACVPKQTGGIFAAASNEDELEPQLQKAFQLALSGTSEDPRLAGAAPARAAGPGDGPGAAAGVHLQRAGHAGSLGDPRQGQPAADQRPHLAHL